MKLFGLLRTKKDKKRDLRGKGYFTDAYQDSLNRLGREQFSTMVSRGIQMPGALI